MHFAAKALLVTALMAAPAEATEEAVSVPVHQMKAMLKTLTDAREALFEMQLLIDRQRRHIELLQRATNCV